MYYVLKQKMQGIKVKIGCRIRMQKAFSLPEAIQRYCEGKKRLKEQNKRQNKSHDSHSQL